MSDDELLKEAIEYADENGICVCDEEYWNHKDLVDAYIAGAEPREKRIAVLEKENAGLKARNQQFAKAKDLLSFWANDFHDDFNHSSKFAERYKFLQETEQFLKESEK